MMGTIKEEDEKKPLAPPADEGQQQRFRRNRRNNRNRWNNAVAASAATGKFEGKTAAIKNVLSPISVIKMIAKEWTNPCAKFVPEPIN